MFEISIMFEIEMFEILFFSRLDFLLRAFNWLHNKTTDQLLLSLSI